MPYVFTCGPMIEWYYISAKTESSAKREATRRAGMRGNKCGIVVGHTAGIGIVMVIARKDSQSGKWRKVVQK